MAELIVLISKVVSVLLWPFSLLPAWIGLFLVSAVAGVVLLWIYGKVSNQAKIKTTKAKVYACLLESILFRHDVLLTLRAQLRMFLAGGRYFSLAIGPVLILMLPCIFLLAGINSRFGYEGFKKGESGIIELELADADLLYKTSIQGSEAVEITPPVRIPELNRVFWRVKLNEDSQPLSLNVKVGDTEFEKQLFSGSNPQKIDAVWSSNWLDKLLYPEGPAKIDHVKSLSLSYPERSYSLGFTDTMWLVFFLIFSMFTGIVASRFIGVEI
jgi:hypothetical protein